MGNPICNLPPGEREAVLGLFRGRLTGEEERGIRALFPQYLFFRNECPDDGWNVSGPVRMCTCTACGESFEAVRGNYPRGKLHNEECNCPACGAKVIGKAVYKFGYAMTSLESWVKAAVAYVSEGGALLIEAGNARRRFTHDELTGEIVWYPDKRYYFGKGVAQMWEERVLAWACEWQDRELKWMPTKTVSDPFRPNWQGYCSYEGDYAIVGLDEAVKAKEEAEAALQAARETSATAQAAGEIDYAAVFPSWNPDSASLKELVDFVSASVDESGAGYIAPADRLAVFDMDGTIICEKAPIYIDSCLTMYRVLDDLKGTRT